MNQYHIINMRSTIIFLISILIAINITSSQQPVGFPCNVPNCQLCSYTNFCGLCNTNYVLQINFTSSQAYCQQVNCTIPNCASCYINNICGACNSGFYLSTTGLCINGPSPYVCTTGCLACNSSSCTICKYGYNLQNGACFPNNGKLLSNCQSSFAGVACQICQVNYVVNPAYQCIPATFNCLVLNCNMCLGSQNICKICQDGYFLNNNTCTQLQCNITNCLKCFNSSICQQCSPGYYGNNSPACQPKYYPCNVSNCIQCQGPQTCIKCNPGYSLSILQQNGTIFGSSCTLITSSVGGFVSVTNCLQFGSMIPGTSLLSIGCINCQPNYINVGGYCVANLTQSNYLCTISNCLYCVQNNICGQCAPGYTVYIGANYMCIKNYSPVPNCALTPIFINNDNIYCVQCSSGYKLLPGTAQTSQIPICVQIPPSGTCNIQNCEYCIQTNSCSQCMAGYNLTNNTCTPYCNIQNCFKCADQISCQTCNYGFYYFNSTCLNGSNQNQNYCISNFGPNCATCSIYNCNSCSQGFTINPNTQLCCPSPVNNIANCNQYQVQWGSGCTSTFRCIQCNFGSLLYSNTPGLLPQCISLPCNLPNCLYCFGSNVCIVCAVNYTLVNGSCTLYQSNQTLCSENCISCNTNNTCTACLNGYLLYNGSCVCSWQNCLTCIGNSFCVMCAYPTIATYTSVGCLPPVIANVQCKIANCFNCLTNNFCVQCDNGFSLQSDGSCQQNYCNPKNNCTLCTQNQAICFLCNQGYVPNQYLASSCVQINQNYTCTVNGCILCSTPTQCLTCSPYYYITNGICQKYVCNQNCIACLQNNTCLFCDVGYYLTSNNNCSISPFFPNATSCPTGSNSIYGCLGCQLNGNLTICTTCLWGFQPSSNGLSCIPQVCSVPNCQICIQNEKFNNGLQLCLVCQQGFLISSNFQCVPYGPFTSISTANCSSIYNCLYCAFNNYCDLCAGGWNPINGTCVTTHGCSVPNCQSCSNSTTCYSCSQNYTLVNNNCVLDCNVQNCIVCSTNPETCGICFKNFVPNADFTNCTCPTQNGFILTNGSCICPSKIIQSRQICFQCLVPYCSFCSSNNTCKTCFPNFDNSNGTCQCNPPLIIVNNQCICPQGQTYYNNSCYACNITNCILCESNGTCSSCNGTLTPQNDGTTCGCNSTFIQNDIQCSCQSGYLPNPINQTCIQCNISNCLYCNQSGICDQCVGNLINTNNVCNCPTNLVYYNEFCYLCNISNCNQCYANNLCISCTSNLIPINGVCGCNSTSTLYNNTCVLCTIQNCNLCSSTNNCINCAISYSLVSSSSCVPCNILFCNSCTSPNFCSSCSNGLQVSSQGNLCLSCSINNCESCLNSYTCISCINGYQLSSNSRSCVVCNLQGCISCSSTGVCTACLTGYFLNNGTCNLCTYPCQTCNPSGSCLTCQFPFSSTPAPNGTCYTCNTPFCFNCNVNNTFQCVDCIQLFSLNSSGSCVYSSPCSINCLNCLLNQTCQSCAIGYTVSATNQAQCIVCTAINCATCYSSNVNSCVKCLPGYFINANGICQSCPYSNCQTCTSTSCITFQPSTGQIAVQINNTIYPAQCDSGCSNCSNINPAVCLNCYPGYVLSANSNCVPCDYPCQTCNLLNTSVCLSCFGNLALVNSTCLACTSSSNCLTCSITNTSQCTTCPNGYFLFNGICQVGCPSNCISCSSNNVCTQCASGFSLTPSNICLPCLYNCRVCSGTDQGVCLQCGLGFYLSNSGICNSCSQFCLTCNQLGCSTCASGYSLNSLFVCIPNCNSPCATCSTTPNTCTSCLLGYTLQQSSFSCVPNTQCSNGLCYYCPQGYVLSANTCIQCASGSNCARCNPLSNNTCYSCLAGYYLSNTTCSKCPSACQTCSSPSNCLSCTSGFTIINQPVSSSGTCSQCAFPCSQCLGSTTTCTSCVGGYVLNGWNCQSSFNFGFFVSLATNLTVFYDNYAQFLNAIVTNYQNVTITSILPGSVNVTGNVSTSAQSASNQAGQQYNSLKSILGGSSIAGMQILASSVTVNGGQLPPSPEPVPPPIPQNNNLAIILGICIPIGVILIGVIVYFVVIKRCCQKQDQTIEYRSNNTTVRETFQLTTKGEPTL